MKISFDPAKRDATLAERGIDFADAARVMNGTEVTLEDARIDYGEQRFLTYGLLGERMVMFAWTPTPDGIRVISMRKCNAREIARFAPRVG